MLNSYGFICLSLLDRYTPSLSTGILSLAVLADHCANVRKRPLTRPGSVCNRNGYLNVYPEQKNIVWHSGQDTLSEYKFTTKSTISHFFCPICGTSVAANRVEDDGSIGWAFNVRYSYTGYRRMPFASGYK